jgi:hypothetical protein
MNRLEQADPHYLGDPTDVIAIALVSLCLKERLCVACLGRLTVRAILSAMRILIKLLDRRWARSGLSDETVKGCQMSGTVYCRLFLAAVLMLTGISIVSAAGRYDGTYVGQATLLPGGNVGACRSFSTSISVTNDKLTYVHGANVAVVTTDIAADGSFNGSGLYTPVRTPVALQLTGKVTGNRIEADSSSPYCKYHLFLTKSG